jgi:cardiolipin synthase
MSWLILFSVAEWLIRLVMAAVILRRRFPPATALAWLSLIFFLPEVGLVVYLLVGVNHLGRRRVRTHRRVIGELWTADRAKALKHQAIRPEAIAEQRGMILQAESISGNPIVSGNAVELLPEASGKIDALVRDIDAAERHVHLLYYIFRPDVMGHRVADALERAAARGVQCRLLVDAAGSRAFLRDNLAYRLQSANVQVVAALPVAPWRMKLARLDLRNHRKIAVIDGSIGYTGSHNIVTEDYGHPRAGKWIDLSARFAGPVVAQLQNAFLDDWTFETDERLSSPDLLPALQAVGETAAQVVPTGPNYEGETFRRVLVAALNAARRRIIITTPYLVPDEPTMLALAMAADRKVQVDIVVPGRSDHPIVGAAGRSYYEPLIDSGINIYSYKSGMLHAKTITVDDSFGLLGSANIDVRSFNLNFEINVLLYGEQITHLLRFAQNKYLAESELVDLTQWQQRPMALQYLEHAAALLSPLL